MIRFLHGAFILIVIVGLGTPGLFAPAAQQLISIKTSDGVEKIAGSADLASLALAAATIGRLKITPKQLSEESPINSASGNEREKVEVLARSVTFPGVLNLGNRMLSVEYQNTTILCFHAAFYAGQAGGLILAMDRDTVLEHKLYWIIDASDDLYDSCLGILLLEASDGQTENYINQLSEVKEEIAEQIQMIQIGLRFAQNVKIKAPEEKLG